MNIVHRREPRVLYVKSKGAKSGFFRILPISQTLYSDFTQGIKGCFYFVEDGSCWEVRACEDLVLGESDEAGVACGVGGDAACAVVLFLDDEGAGVVV